MTAFARIRNIIAGLLMIAGAVVIIILPDSGITIAAFVFSVSLLAFGVRKLIYYFTMARHMVGGRSMLYFAVLLIDLAAFTFSLLDAARVYLMLYLIALHAFSGVIDILRAFEARKYDSPWISFLAEGVINILFAVAGGIFILRLDIASYILGAGIIYSGVMRLVTAFRKTGVIYIA